MSSEMQTSDILKQLHKLGVTVSVSGDRVLLEPGSRVPRSLLEALRRDKAEVLAYLKEHPDWVAEMYQFRYPGAVGPADDELEEIEQYMTRNGYVLLWSTELEDLVAFYLTDADRAKVPPGFVPYSERELKELFGKTADPSLNGLRLIHHAKKLGAKIKSVEEEDS